MDGRQIFTASTAHAKANIIKHHEILHLAGKTFLSQLYKSILIYGFFAFFFLFLFSLGPSTSTNNNYQQTSQLVNNQDSQQQQPQTQHLMHQQSANISNSNNNLISNNNYGNYGNTTTTISSAAAPTSTSLYGTSTNSQSIPRPMQKVSETIVESSSVEKKGQAK